MTESIGVDISGLTTLAAVLRRVEPSLAKELQTGVAVAGEVIATKARSNASFSTRIPGTIQVRRRALSVKVRAGGPDAPHAPALEHGGQPGTFRHPVFGRRDVWVDQPAHPFLGIDETTQAAALALLDHAVDRALKGISVV